MLWQKNGQLNGQWNQIFFRKLPTQLCQLVYKYIVELESIDIGQCQIDTVESDSTVRRVNDSLESDSITSLTQRS